MIDLLGVILFFVGLYAWAYEGDLRGAIFTILGILLVIA